ncbi:TPA: hypothetical protein MJC91_21085 [Klebsiella pneumoniae]|nr:hypothetical protein [Klebsiella pneumoniae]
MRIPESTTTQELERRVISLMNKWRYTKGKLGKKSV